MQELTQGAHGELLALSGLTKRYGEVLAVAQVDLVLKPGEVVGLVGENGAGKSTIVNMITGMTAPDEGEIRLAGAAMRFASPRDALVAGIGVVHQHYALVPSFTVAETFALGSEGAGPIDSKRLRTRVAELAQEVGIAINPDARIGSLDVAGQQRVEILKALSRDIRLLVLDEPTAVLSREDADRLFAVVARLRARGVAVLLITHKLSDVFSVCDRAAIMHAGRLVADRPVAELTPQRVVSLMISGREETETRPDIARVLSDDFTTDRREDAAGTAGADADERAARSTSAPVVGAYGVTLHRRNGSLAVEGLDFQLHPGEILAVAGVDGNGQSELVRCLAGLDQPAAGYFRVRERDSRNARAWNARDLRIEGVAHIPDDRRRHGIVEELALSENLLLSHFFSRRYRRLGLLRRRRAVADTRTAIAAYDIRTTGPAQPIGRLSGGNQQKLVLARELLAEPGIVLAAHPSRGLDVRTIAFVQDLLRERRNKGAAILLVSADLGEIWGLADRVMVFAAGRVRGPVRVSQTDRTEVGAWMAGH